MQKTRKSRKINGGEETSRSKSKSFKSAFKKSPRSKTKKNIRFKSTPERDTIYYIPKHQSRIKHYDSIRLRRKLFRKGTLDYRLDMDKIEDLKKHRDEAFDKLRSESDPEMRAKLNSIISDSTKQIEDFKQKIEFKQHMLENPKLLLKEKRRQMEMEGRKASVAEKTRKKQTPFKDLSPASKNAEFNKIF